jgi:hypothetical protein
VFNNLWIRLVNPRKDNPLKKHRKIPRISFFKMKVNLYNDFLDSFVLKINLNINQFFIIPISRRISVFNFYNLLEIFLMRTSFSFYKRIDSGETGRSVEGIVFFKSLDSKLFSCNWLILDPSCLILIRLKMLLIKSYRDLPYFWLIPELGEIALYLRIDLFRILYSMSKMFPDLFDLKVFISKGDDYSIVLIWSDL